MVQLYTGQRAVGMNHIRHHVHHGQGVLMNTVRAEKIEQLGIIAKVIPRVYPKMTGVYDAGPAAGPVHRNIAPRSL